MPLARRPVLFALLRVWRRHGPAKRQRDEPDRPCVRRASDECVPPRAFAGRNGTPAPRARAARRAPGHPRWFRAGAARGGPPVEVLLLLPPIESPDAAVLALLADGEAWSASALALALGQSPRTVQRALVALEEAGQVRDARARPLPALAVRASGRIRDDLVTPDRRTDSGRQGHGQTSATPNASAELGSAERGAAWSRCRRAWETRQGSRSIAPPRSSARGPFAGRRTSTA